MFRVVTDMGILGFDETSRAMTVLALHPGVSAETIKANTGFELPVPADVPTTEAPTSNELAILRELDPARLYTA